MSKPSTTAPMNVTRLATPSAQRQKPAGRPKTLEMPPIPQELLDSMTPLEQQHYHFCVDAYSEAFVRKYGKMTPTAQLLLHQLGFNYIHLLRLQTTQMRDDQLVSQARQHPGNEMRAILTSLGLNEKDLEEPKKQEDSNSEARATLLRLSQS